MLSFDEIEDCLPMGGGTTDDGSVIVSAQWLHDFAHAVAATEREACAKVCDRREREPLDDEAPLVWLRAASAIRERSNAMYRAKPAL